MLSLQPIGSTNSIPVRAPAYIGASLSPIPMRAGGSNTPQITQPVKGVRA